ncbi:MAG: hypothetical protein LIP77_01135 [Planctomycetes bacterium]|nr:hypothetical protein [Planctomycetota bacterium]
MADYDTGGLRSVQAALQSIGKDYVRMDASGHATAATSGKVGRFFGRLAAHFGHGVQESNQRTIEALARQLEHLPEDGLAASAVFRTGASSLLSSGKPLSGRRIARVLGEALETVQQRQHERFLQQREQAHIASGRETEAILAVGRFFSPDGGEFASSVAGLEQMLGLDPGASEVLSRRTDMKNALLRDFAAGRVPDDPAAVAKGVVRQAVLTRYVDLRLDHLVAAMRDAHALDGLDIDTAAFGDRLRRSASFSGEHEPFDPEQFFEGLEVTSRAFAAQLRHAALTDRLQPYLAVDESETGLLVAYRQAAESVVAGANIRPQSLALLQEMLAKNIARECEGKPIPAGEDLRRLRDRQLDAFCRDLQALPDLPEDQAERELVLRTFIEKGLPIDPALVRFTLELSTAVRRGIESGLKFTEADDLRLVFRNFVDVSAVLHGQAMTQADALNRELGSEDFTIANELAFALGLNRLADRIGVRQVVNGILIHGSPFFDLAYALNTEVQKQGGESSTALALQSQMRMLELGLTGIMEDDPGLSAPDISHLSLPFFRKLGGHIATGARTGKNYDASAAMQAVAGTIMADKSAELVESTREEPWGGNADSPSLALCDTFRADFSRSYYMIAGRFQRAAGATDSDGHADYVAAFPDRRSAYQVSTVLHQQLGGFMFQGLRAVPDLLEVVLGNAFFSIGAKVRQSYRVTPGSVPGEYYVNFEYDYRSGADSAEAKRTFPDRDRHEVPAGYKMRVDITIMTGDQPAVTACVPDILCYDWE